MEARFVRGSGRGMHFYQGSIGAHVDIVPAQSTVGPFWEALLEDGLGFSVLWTSVLVKEESNRIIKSIFLHYIVGVRRTSQKALELHKFAGTWERKRRTLPRRRISRRVPGRQRTLVLRMLRRLILGNRV
jgi:hypothetical protein